MPKPGDQVSDHLILDYSRHSSERLVLFTFTGAQACGSGHDTSLLLRIFIFVIGREKISSAGELQSNGAPFKAETDVCSHLVEEPPFKMKIIRRDIEKGPVISKRLPNYVKFPYGVFLSSFARMVVKIFSVMSATRCCFCSKRYSCARSPSDLRAPFPAGKEGRFNSLSYFFLRPFRLTIYLDF